MSMSLKVKFKFPCNLLFYTSYCVDIFKYCNANLVKLYSYGMEKYMC